MDLPIYIVIFVSLTSIVCVIFVLITWCKLPKFRTVQNYISMNQIITGTLHFLIANLGNSLIDFNYYNPDLFEALIVINGMLFYSTLSWSLCGSLTAYWKLVLLRNTRMSHEKLKATFFVYCIVAIINIIKDEIVSKIIK